MGYLMIFNDVNKRERNISIICHSVAGAALLALLVIASFFDLKISQTIGNDDSFYGILFQIIAEYPQYLVLPVSSVIIFFNNDIFERKAQKIAIMVLGVLLGLVGWFLFCFQSEKLVIIPHLLELSIFFAIALTTAGLAFGRLIPKKTAHKLFKWAVFALCVTAISLVFAQGLKAIWHRMRFRDMIAEGSYDGFTPWYVVNSFRGTLNDAYHYSSFPSGHTTSAVHIFLIVPLLDIFKVENKRFVKYIANCICAIFVVLTMFARIVNCAHFLSDVVVATIITYSIYYLFKTLFFGTENKPKSIFFNAEKEKSNADIAKIN